MKIALIIIAIFFLSNTTLAVADQKEKIFCPEKIECYESRNLASCKAVGDELLYWGSMGENGRVEKGTYLFQAAGSSYEAPASSTDESWCAYYFRTDSGNLKTISLKVKEGANLEALVDETIPTMWSIGGYGASCFPGYDRIKCPFTRISALGIFNNTTSAKILMYSHGVEISDAAHPIYSNSYKRKLGYDEALYGCGNDPKCTIELIASTNEGEYIRIGDVIVAMDNKMQILQINSLPDSKYKITKQEGINSIEIIQNASGNLR